MNKTIGLISDTHGLVRPEVMEALKGVDIIVHAGDVGEKNVLKKLELIAPVVAVRGNTDTSPFGMTLPKYETLQVGSFHLYILHDLCELDMVPDPKVFQCIISGHTHQPEKVMKKGVLFINPGSAGPRRYKLPISVGKLTLFEEGHEYQWIDLNLLSTCE